MKSVIKNLLAGVLVVTLANVGMFTLDQEVAMAANCSLTTTNDMFGSSTRGYCGNDYVNLTTTNDNLEKVYQTLGKPGAKPARPFRQPPYQDPQLSR